MRIRAFDASAANAGDFRQGLYGGYAVYEGRRAEVLSEIYHFNHKDLFSPSATFEQSFNATAYYVQLAYGLWENRYKPYVRYEALGRRSEDPYFSTLGVSDYHRVTGGIRWNLTPQAALKFEGRSHENTGSNRYMEVTIQCAFSF